MTAAEADEDVLAWAAALIVTPAGLGTLAGAVYRPAAVIVPQAAPEQPAPETLHVTAVFFVPETVARNCCWSLTVTIAVVGETVTWMGMMIVTVAEADVTPSAVDVAVTVTCAGVGTVSGAV